MAQSQMEKVRAAQERARKEMMVKPGAVGGDTEREFAEEGLLEERFPVAEAAFSRKFPPSGLRAIMSDGQKLLEQNIDQACAVAVLVVTEDGSLGVYGHRRTLLDEAILYEGVEEFRLHLVDQMGKSRFERWDAPSCGHRGAEPSDE